jgi:hypothetical protein
VEIEMVRSIFLPRLIEWMKRRLCGSASPVESGCAQLIPAGSPTFRNGTKHQAISTG